MRKKKIDRRYLSCYPAYMAEKTQSGVGLQLIREIQSRAKALGLTPAAVLTTAGVSPALWELWFCGQVSPTLSSLDKVFAALDELEKSRGRK